MAPMKTLKSINASRYNSFHGKGEKSQQKKRSLSDMLGPQWNQVELRSFYEAYRKYGKHWKKVASIVRSRSTEMVEGLYNMNRAYLSLPEGTASVSGLIAMMTDHYNVMDGSGSEKETEDVMLKARKVQKHQKAKGHRKENNLHRQSIRSSDKSVSGNCLRTPPIGSSDRGLSLLRMLDGIRPDFPVRKRTPRVPVSWLVSHPNKKPKGSVTNGNDNELSHGALVLTERRPNHNTANGSNTSYKRFEYLLNSLTSAREKPKSGGFEANEESVGAEDALNGYKKEKGKKKEIKIYEATMKNDVRDAYRFSHKEPRIIEDIVNDGAKIDRSPSEGHRKRRKTQRFEDERAACDALQSLAEVSLMMPHHAIEPVSDAQDSVSVRDTLADDTQLDVTLQEASPALSKRRKSQVSKKVELLIDLPTKQTENENLADEKVKFGDRNAHISSVSKPCKSLVKSADWPSRNDRHMEETEVAESSTQIEASNHTIEHTGRKHRRKRDRPNSQKERNHDPSVYSSNYSSLFQTRVQCVKDKVSHCLSSPDVRRWCAYEWFYSAIDYPWFARREFVEYLNHVGLGHIPRLTRVEWGVIRSSLGKPRRLSGRFLQEEREKLEKYRESIRTHYANVHAGLSDGLPNDLARPLSVGQQVVSIHPKTRELHSGYVLAVDRHKCLVQFDRRDLGAEFVMDIDCMPLNPMENMPESRRQQKMPFNYWHSQLPKINGSFMPVSDERMQNLDPFLHVPQFTPTITNDMKVKQVCKNSHAKVAGSGSLQTSAESQSQDTAQLQSRKGDTSDMRPIPWSAQGLVTKAPQHCGSSGNSLCWPHPVATSGGVNQTLHYSNSSMHSHEEENASNVVEIVQESMQKAQKMVDVAVKVMSSMRKDEDAYGRIGEAFNASIKAEGATNFHMSSVMMSSNSVQGDFTPQNPVASSRSNPQLAGYDSCAKPAADISESDVQVPSELISSCVATLLMIQKGTERQYPPAEVARILDTAVTRLQPCCSQNLSIYREIQMCMGRIKTQILALVPT